MEPALRDSVSLRIKAPPYTWQINHKVYIKGSKVNRRDTCHRCTEETGTTLCFSWSEGSRVPSKTLRAQDGLASRGFGEGLPHTLQKMQLRSGSGCGWVCVHPLAEEDQGFYLVSAELPEMLVRSRHTSTTSQPSGTCLILKGIRLPREMDRAISLGPTLCHLGHPPGKRKTF